MRTYSLNYRTMFLLKPKHAECVELTYVMVLGSLSKGKRQKVWGLRYCGTETKEGREAWGVKPPFIHHGPVYLRQQPSNLRL
jgi:hypothetical protein